MHIRLGRSGSHEPYTVNLVRGLARVDEENEYVLFVTPANRQLFDVPNARFRQVCVGVPGGSLVARIAVEQGVLPFLLLANHVDVLHVPGNIGPVCVPCPSVAQVVHHHKASTKKLSQVRMWWMHMLDALHYFHKHHSLITATVLGAVLAGDLAFKVLIYAPRDLLSVRWARRLLGRQV